jgi:hypothetical protein
MNTMEHAVRLYFSEVAHQGARLKTGAEKPRIEPYVGRAEFFALPRIVRKRDTEQATQTVRQIDRVCAD